MEVRHVTLLLGAALRIVFGRWLLMALPVFVAPAVVGASTVESGQTLALPASEADAEFYLNAAKIFPAPINTSEPSPTTPPPSS